MRPISSLTYLSGAIVLSAALISFTGEKYQAIQSGTDGEVVVLDQRDGTVCWVNQQDGYYQCSRKFREQGQVAK